MYETYYVDINNSYTTEGVGSDTDPFNWTQWLAFVSTEDTFYIRGSRDEGASEISLCDPIVNPIFQAWNLLLYGPWRLKTTSYLLQGNGGSISGVIIDAGEFIALNMTSTNSYLRSRTSRVNLRTTYGCTIIGSLAFEGAYLNVTFTDCIIDCPIVDLDYTFNKCVFSVADWGGVATKNNCQFSWTPPTWPAGDAPLVNFNKYSQLNYNTINRNPGYPEYGTPPYITPYTSYEYDLFGSARNDIGAYAFETEPTTTVAPTTTTTVAPTTTTTVAPTTTTTEAPTTTLAPVTTTIPPDPIVRRFGGGPGQRKIILDENLSRHFGRPWGTMADYPYQP